MLSSTIKFGSIALVFFLVLAQFGQKITSRSLDRRTAPAPIVQASTTPIQTSQYAPTAPVGPVTSSLDEYRIAPNQQGHYITDVFINGQAVNVIVDTGATSVALKDEDAAALGIFPAPSDYKYQVSTANGLAKVARVRLRQVRLGFLTVDDVEAMVGERGALQTSLLGMTYLSKLHVEMASGTLVLRY